MSFLCCDLEYCVKNHRRKVISAGLDWMRLAVIMGAQKKKLKTVCVPFLDMKPSGNESFNGPDHEMVCDRRFLGFFVPDRSLRSSTDDVTI